MNIRRTPFTRITVGLDSEGLAAGAVARGMELAEEFDAELDLLHAVPLPFSLWPGLDEKERTAIHARTLAAARTKVLHGLREAVPDAGKRAPVENGLRVLPGHPAQVILDHVEQSASDLIVLGAHAKRTVFDFGGTARPVLSRSTVPLWHQVGPPSPIERLLVAVDFSEHSRRAVEYAHALAMQLGAAVVIFHCYEPPSFAYEPGEDNPEPHYVIDEEREAAKSELERWTAASQWEPLRVESLCVEGDPMESVLEQAQNADLIVMGTHGRTGLTRFLLGSVAYGVLKQATQPVLVIPSAKQEWLLGSGVDEPDAATE